MKYMLILTGDEKTESGAAPSDADLTAMGEYNQKLIGAGVLLAGEGLHPSSEGARVEYSGDDRTVVDGPFTETKELIAGFWIIQTAGKEEALEWARRVPLTSGSVQVRRIYDIAEFDQEHGSVKQERQWREDGGEPRTA
ncbi:YciI family protein [Leifsonia poae]|uniref:YciI family protein n=1 Tax=Leifsonia poae TaxID=110933 RepID=UPI001CBE1E05|nr:YciI family protein [Leifsonia poae]